jgi:IS5 family transposase
VIIVKCFILQIIYDLSDPRLEEEIADRRSFQLFLGLNSGDSIPDDTTIVRYRDLFVGRGLDKKLFQEFKEQLKRSGLILEKGTLVDVTIKQAQAAPKSQKDKDANFTQKKNKKYYGYKDHIDMDSDTKIIHTTEFTQDSVHDSDMFDHLVTGKERSIIADKDYCNRERKK